MNEIEEIQISLVLGLFGVAAGFRVQPLVQIRRWYCLQKMLHLHVIFRTKRKESYSLGVMIANKSNQHQRWGKWKLITEVSLTA